MALTPKTSKLATIGKHYGSILAMFLGVLISLIIFMLVNNWEKQKLQDEFQEIAYNNTYRLRNKISEYVTELNAIKRFYQSSNFVNRQEFHHFVAPILKTHPEIQALEWAPKVNHSERDKYTEQARQAGFHYFNIREKTANGRFVQARKRETYFPVYYLEPMEGNEAAFGFDLGSNRERLESLLAAQASRTSIASKPVKLIQDNAAKIAFLIFTPVFSEENNHTPMKQNQTNLLGFVLGVFRIQDIVEAAIPTTAADKITIRILDDTTPKARQLLYSNNLAQTQSYTVGIPTNQFINNINHNVITGEFRFNTIIKVAGRRWLLEYHSGTTYAAQEQHWESWLALAISLLISGWVAFYIRSNQRRTSTITSLANQRTRELQASESYNQTIFRTMSEGLIICTREGIIDTFNPAAEQLYGYSASEVLGKDINILVPEPYHEPYATAFHDYLQTGQLGIIQPTNEFKGKRKDNSTFTIEYSVNPMQYHDKTKYIITVHDISDRKQAEEALRNSATSLEHLHNISTQPTLTLEEKAQRILALGLHHLGLSLGIISHIDDETYTVVYCAGENAIKPGTVFPLNETYCAMTLKANGPIGFHNESLKQNYIQKEQDKFGLAAYISAPFMVDGQYYGTLNFSSMAPRKKAFTQQDFSLIKIMAQWFGSEISRDLANKEINRIGNLFESLFRDTPEPIGLASVHREVLMINPAFSKVFGYEPQEIIGNKTTIFYENENAYIDQGKIRYNPNTSLTPKPYEIKYRRKNGEVFPAETVSTVLKDNNNETIAFLVHIRDISARKEAEYRLAKQAREARLLHQGTTIASETSSFIEALQNCIDMVCEIMEWPVGNVYIPDETSQMVLPSGIWHFDELEKHKQLYQTISNSPLKRGKGICGKVWQTGTTQWIQDIKGDPDFEHLHGIDIQATSAVGFPIYVDHTIVAILGFYTYHKMDADYDLLRVLQVLGEQLGHVFEKRRAEKAITDAEERSRLILESAGEGIYGIDRYGKTIFVNPAAELMIGYSAGELIGKAMHNFIHHSYADGTPYPIERSSTQRVFSTGDVQHVSNEALWRKDGSHFPAEYTTTPMWKNGKIVGAVVTFSDITERHRMEKMKSEFVATVSHELRTPLTSIRGSLGLLAGGVAGELPEKAQNMVEIASKNSERLLLLINDILDMEKINSGKMEFNLTQTELNPVIEDAIEGSQAYARQYGVTFRYKSNPAPIASVIDRDRLLQVMSNLLSNAAKFSPTNAFVDIRIERLPQHPPKANDQLGSVRISVTDRGSGIPKAFQSRIFEKFCQADASDSRQKGGTGLGLHISKSIVERMNGKIGFITAEGRGTTFYVDLPEATSAGQQTPQRRAADQGGH